MELIRNLLEVWSYGFPLFVIAQRWWRQRGIEIDHVFLFSCGFIFYLLLPISFGFGTGELLSGYGSPYEAWKEIFQRIPNSIWVIYFASCLLFYVAFVAGDMVGEAYPSKWQPKELQSDTKTMYVFLAAAIMLGIALGYPLYQNFFDYGAVTRMRAHGAFTAVSMFFLTLTILYSALKYQQQELRSFWRVIYHPFSLVYLVVVLLLVFMGGRVIVFSSLLAVLVLYSVYFRRLKIWHIVFIFFATIWFSQAIQLFRIQLYAQIFNSWQYTYLRGVAFHVATENFNVSHSLIDFLHTYSIPLLRFPITLLTGMIGLIPSFIMPNKMDFVLSPPVLGYLVNSPNGGMNAFVSLMIDFGFIGSMVFLFSFSFLLRRIKRWSMFPYGAMYVLISGWLGLMFFRDFQQTFIKAILEFSVIAPLMIAVICSFVVRRRARLISKTPEP